MPDGGQGAVTEPVLEMAVGGHDMDDKEGTRVARPLPAPYMGYAIGDLMEERGFGRSRLRESSSGPILAKALHWVCSIFCPCTLVRLQSLPRDRGQLAACCKGRNACLDHA